ncbi:MAG: hypothetical protein ABSG42_05425 [Nitrospirota bacterium]
MRPKELWVFLFFIGTLALSWPFIEIFGANLPAYLFMVWILLIAAIYLLIRRTAREEDGG